MAVTQESNRRSWKAAADLSAKQYFIVKLNSSKELALAAAATDILLGVLLNKPKQGEAGEVFLRNATGTGKVKLGGTVAINDKLTANANGEAIVTTTAGNEILGYALEAGVSGDVVDYRPATDRV